MVRSYRKAQRLLTATFNEVKSRHGAEGHEYIRTHWRRYIHLVMRMPDIQPGWNVLEVGASILSNLIRGRFDANMVTVYHELEPEWNSRFETSGIRCHAAELLHDRLPLGDETFDFILLNEVLEHFPVNPAFFLRQLIARLKPDGQMMVTVPNFATSEKRLQLLTGTNPQDAMDDNYVYYAHHREPVMRECLDMVAVCGGSVIEYEWSDFDIDPNTGSLLLHCLRCLRHGKFHRILHQIIPQTRSYLFLRVKKDPAAIFDHDLMRPPLSLTKEFGRTEKPEID